MKSMNKIHLFNLYAEQRKPTDLIYRKGIKNPNLSLLSCGILILNFGMGLDLFYFDGIFKNGFIFIIILLIFGYILNMLSFILFTKCYCNNTRYYKFY